MTASSSPRCSACRCRPDRPVGACLVGSRQLWYPGVTPSSGCEATQWQALGQAAVPSVPGENSARFVIAVPTLADHRTDIGGLAADRRRRRGRPGSRPRLRRRTGCCADRFGHPAGEDPGPGSGGGRRSSFRPTAAVDLCPQGCGHLHDGLRPTGRRPSPPVWCASSRI